MFGCFSDQNLPQWLLISKHGNLLLCGSIELLCCLEPEMVVARGFIIRPQGGSGQPAKSQTNRLHWEKVSKNDPVSKIQEPSPILSTWSQTLCLTDPDPTFLIFALVAVFCHPVHLDSTSFKQFWKVKYLFFWFVFFLGIRERFCQFVEQPVPLLSVLALFAFYQELEPRKTEDHYATFCECSK